jgi:hypothetical protein
MPPGRKNNYTIAFKGEVRAILEYLDGNVIRLQLNGIIISRFKTA